MTTTTTTSTPPAETAGTRPADLAGRTADTAGTPPADIAGRTADTAGTPPADAAGVEISEKAATHIRALAAQHGTPAGGLRLGVKGGGCSGLSYVIDWAAEPGANDRVYEKDGARVFVDPRSAKFVAGTVIEWKQTLMQSGFDLRNPNVKTSCGCGESFSV